MPGAQIPTSVTRLESMLGYQAVSLTNFDSSALSAIAAGSKVEIAGAFFTFTVDEAIEASTWTAITTGNTAYIALIPAGVAGSQTVTARFTATAPVWSTSKQGWYASAGSSTRVIGSVYKNEATVQLQKRIFEPRQDYAFRGIVELITTGSGYWTVPSDVTRIRVTCVGGGGGGSAGESSNGGGGGGGTNISLVTATVIDVLPGQLIAYSVGAGGAGGAPTGGLGSDGVDTTFGTITGGKGYGGKVNYPRGGAGSLGGAGAGGNPGSGGPGAGSGGGAGASGGFGSTLPGVAGYGGGGGGGGFTTVSIAGSAGGSGIIIIEY
jgi:hypothetical protein